MPDIRPAGYRVMIICTGKATKRIEEFQYHTKEYIATLQLGLPPFIRPEKEIDATYPTEHITRVGRGSLAAFYRQDRTDSACFLGL